METVSDNNRWVICPVCHKGNPAGTRFCQHCWGAILTKQSEVTSEELAEATRRRRVYLLRKKIFKIAALSLGSLAVLGCILLFLSYYTDIIVKPPAHVNSDALPGEWNMFRRDLEHSGGEQSGVTPRGELKWVYTTDAAVRSSPAVVGGTVYIGSQDYNLYALDAETGNTHWVFPT